MTSAGLSPSERSQMLEQRQTVRSTELLPRRREGGGKTQDNHLKKPSKFRANREKQGGGKWEA